MAQSKSENMPEIKSEDIDVLRAEAGHEDGGGGPTVSGDALYDDDTSRNDLIGLMNRQVHVRRPCCSSVHVRRRRMWYIYKKSIGGGAATCKRGPQ